MNDNFKEEALFSLQKQGIKGITKFLGGKVRWLKKNLIQFTESSSIWDLMAHLKTEIKS